jgi:hypothetical protein
MSFVPLNNLPTWADLPVGGLSPVFTPQQIQQAVQAFPESPVYVNPNGTLIGVELPGLPNTVVWSPVADNAPYDFVTESLPPVTTCWTCETGTPNPPHHRHHHMSAVPEPQMLALMMVLIGALLCRKLCM